MSSVLLTRPPQRPLRLRIAVALILALLLGLTVRCAFWLQSHHPIRVHRPEVASCAELIKPGW